MQQSCRRERSQPASAIADLAPIAHPRGSDLETEELFGKSLRSKHTLLLIEQALAEVHEELVVVGAALLLHRSQTCHTNPAKEGRPRYVH